MPMRVVLAFTLPLEPPLKLPFRYVIGYHFGVGRVLVVDDDAVILDLLRTVLADEGHAVAGFANLDAAPADPSADLVITDLVPLSDYNARRAREWVAHLRDRYAGTPLIVVTAHNAALSEGDALGADAVVGKPFDVDVLLSKVRELLH